MRQFLALAVAILLSACGAVDRRPESVVEWTSAVVAGGPAHSGWWQFCRNEPAECEPRAGVAVIPYEVAERINFSVNNRIRYVSDREHFGALDYWALPRDGMGDCEDIALEKRRLLRITYSSKAMRMAHLMEDGSAESHAVLIVTTERGDFALDNNYGEPMRLSELGLRTVAIENNGQWYGFSHIDRGGAHLAAGPR